MLRKKKGRAKWREIHRLEKIAERDRRRVAKGLLPLKEANAAKVKQHREKIAALKESITNCWFAPSLDLDAVVSQRIADSPNLDPSTVRGLVAATERNCAANSLNLNAFVLKRGFHIACHARTIFHELIEQGVPLAEAAQRCHRESFK